VLVSKALALKALLVLPFRLFHFFFLSFVKSNKDPIKSAAEKVEA
jgi:hypothetical protein